MAWSRLGVISHDVRLHRNQGQRATKNPEPLLPASLELSALLLWLLSAVLTTLSFLHGMQHGAPLSPRLHWQLHTLQAGISDCCDRSVLCLSQSELVSLRSLPHPTLLSWCDLATPFLCQGFWQKVSEKGMPKQPCLTMLKWWVKQSTGVVLELEEAGGVAGWWGGLLRCGTHRTQSLLDLKERGRATAGEKLSLSSVDATV